MQLTDDVGLKGLSGHGRDMDLQIIRAVAALLVLVDHAVLSIIRSQNLMDTHAPLAALSATLGGMGVCAFFVLSGYIMLETNRGGFDNSRSAMNFMFRRFLRIAPIYYVGTLLAFLLLTVMLDKTIPPIEFVYSLLFLPHYGTIENAGFFPILGVGWTLNMEMFFYLLFAIAMRLSPRHGSWIVIGAIGGVFLLGRLLAGHGVISEQAPLYFYTKTTMLMFAVGILLRQYKRVFAALLRPLSGLLDFYVIILGLILLAGAYALGFHALKPLGKLIESMAALLVISAIFRAIRMPIGIRNIFVFLGDASYSLYVFHTLILIVTIHLYGRTGLPAGAGIAPVLLNLVAALAGSLLCYRWIETPLREKMEKPLRRWADARCRTPFLPADGLGVREVSGRA